MCSGKGHTQEICSNNVTALAYVDRSSRNDGSGADVSSEDAKAFICNTPGKLSGISSESNEEDCRELPWQRGDVPVICDSGASYHMSVLSTGMFNYRESNATMRTASGEKCSIEGYGDLSLTLRSSSGGIPLLLKNVSHVPRLSYHMLSLRAVAERGHTFFGDHVTFL